MGFTKQFLRLSISLAVLSVIGTSSFAIANDAPKGHSKDVGKKDVPVAVMAAFEKTYPHAIIKEVEKSEKDGQILYEIGSKNGTSEIEVGYAADGTLIQVTEDIAIKTLPDTVKKTIEAEYPKGKMKDVEKITHGTTVEYEVDVIVGKEKSMLILDETGKILSTKKETGNKYENEKSGGHGKEDKE